LTPEDRWELPEAIGHDGAAPDGEAGHWWAIEGRLTADPVAAAERLPGRFAIAGGLVDSHFHMAFLYGAVRVEMDAALDMLRAARDQGVLLVRDLGAHDRLSLRLPADPQLPRVIGAGQHLAVEGGFVEGSHEPVAPDDLVGAALGEMDAGATWVKVITDWQPGELAYPLPVLREMVDAVHARGGRIAAHAERTGRAILPAGIDSIEHGFNLEEEDLRLMAEQGVAWAPTTNLFVRDLEEVDGMLAGDVEPDRRQRLEGWRQGMVDQFDHVRATVPLAARLGVTLLASTDTCGTVADEVERWIGWGVDPAIAVGSASWDARHYLGANGLADGASADVVTFDEDPRLDPSALRRPAAILLRGRRVK
jgi:imidazolonepropionase-like amidohydrolase